MQHSQSGVSWFMFTCVHITSIVILESISIVSCIVVCAFQIVLNLGLAKPDVLYLLASLCMLHCATMQLWPNTA